MNENKHSGIEGLYVLTLDKSKWILNAQKHDKSNGRDLVSFFRIWRSRERMLGDHRVRVIKSDKAIIYNNHR